MLQMDMTAWVKAGTKEVVGIIQDFVDPTLTNYLEALVTEYRESRYIDRADDSRHPGCENQVWLLLLRSL